MTDPTDELAEAALAGARLANDPDALRARLHELEGKSATKARQEIQDSITAGTFNDQFDARDPELMRAIQAAGQETR